MVNDMAWRAWEAEERVIFHTAKLARVQKEAEQKAAQAAE